MNSPFQRLLARTLAGAMRTAARVPFFGGALVKAGFDAVRQTWGERSWLFQSLQDAWIEIDKQTRYELQRIHGGLVENSCIVQKIRSLFLQFSVGASGLICTPNASTMDGTPGADTKEEKTEVENWNHQRAESWAKWFRAPELNSNITGGQLTRVWAGLLFDTGEIFVNLTAEALPGVSKGSVPKFQTIDSHRCETPSEHHEWKGNPIVDGVEMTPQGKPVAYWIRRTNFNRTVTVSNAGALYDRIPAYDPRNWKAGGIIHKFKVRRPGQVRGIPEGFSVYNIVRDNMDLHKLEMQAAKLASSIGNVTTNPAGELDTTTNRSARNNILSQVGNTGALANKNFGVDYNVTIGTSSIAMKTGDKLDQFMISRPTVATQDYWDLHYTMICIGYEVPKMLVMPYSLQGTVTRADLDVCGYGFGQVNFEIVAELLRDGYEWQAMWAKDYDRSMDGAWPVDFSAVFIRPPRKPNVDIGYTAKALEIELRLGTKTLPDVYAEKQQDFRTKLREIAEAQKFIQDLGKEFGVDPSQITSLAVSESMQTSMDKQNAGGNAKEGDGEQTGAEATGKALVHA